MSSLEKSAPRASLRILLVLLFVTIPLLNPWVRGDGVGYYAFARALLIQRNLDFSADYHSANTSFREARLDENGIPRPDFLTVTGHLENHFTIGPAILWSPFLIVAHVGVLTARAFGSTVAADGFSQPYRIAMALGTLFYGFLGLLLSFWLARKFVEERWALLATIAVWWASSLPVYMYFNPSWSHAHSAFVVALFFWYWEKTRVHRTTGQWMLLGVIAALMLNVYYANVTLLAVLIPGFFSELRSAFRKEPAASTNLRSVLFHYLLFGFLALALLFPTFLSRMAIYGSPFRTGYIPVSNWAWFSPYFLQVLFSANHGLLSWTPVLILSLIGLILFLRKQPDVGLPALFAVLAFYYFISSYPDWAGISSFGNRFFVSLTVFFVLGLAFFLQRVFGQWRSRARSLAASSALVLLFIFWNLGMMFQWGSHLIPARGPISWRSAVHNQFFVVPSEIWGQFHEYLFRRKELMKHIEQRDVEQLRQSQPDK